MGFLLFDQKQKCSDCYQQSEKLSRTFQIVFVLLHLSKELAPVFREDPFNGKLQVHRRIKQKNKTQAIEQG